MVTGDWLQGLCGLLWSVLVYESVNWIVYVLSLSIHTMCAQMQAHIRCVSS